MAVRWLVCAVRLLLVLVLVLVLLLLLLDPGTRDIGTRSRRWGRDVDGLGVR